ncbi:TPA: hypothetical protein HH295_03770 [Xanthomonas vasicola pv. zeae]|uniref:hypothetical protein n=1 Tax=Xanthomonas vasicola TaxID=56459 RepID=UPI000F74242B|nr:hypothetical protein [Xanthomonas vasicola]TWQ10470.1 hypothetical protein FQK02_18455 [Xanthomonas vasicola]HHZ22473.1 hypothetical protein [Xanthomonas vasicola pv. zeae]HHZ29857.1 hypothetical protein [Xanthomonas vasicola pv. zeae]HHZ38308.1 hypothetical protein [Xanthomonas vasicola pv. zeae]
MALPNKGCEAWNGDVRGVGGKLAASNAKQCACVISECIQIPLAMLRTLPVSHELRLSLSLDRYSRRKLRAAELPACCGQQSTLAKQAHGLTRRTVR